MPAGTATRRSPANSATLDQKPRPLPREIQDSSLTDRQTDGRGDCKKRMGERAGSGIELQEKGNNQECTQGRRNAGQKLGNRIWQGSSKSDIGGGNRWPREGGWRKKAEPCSNSNQTGGRTRRQKRELKLECVRGIEAAGIESASSVQRLLGMWQLKLSSSQTGKEGALRGGLFTTSGRQTTERADGSVRPALQRQIYLVSPLRWSDASNQNDPNWSILPKVPHFSEVVVLSLSSLAAPECKQACKQTSKPPVID